MNWTDIDLMAYVDGQLDAEARRALDAAMAVDATLRERVAALAAQRRRVVAAYAGTLDEPVPDRLLALLSANGAEPAPPSNVVELAAERSRRAQPKAQPSWLHWGGIAASVVFGVLLGMQFDPLGRGSSLLIERGGQIVAGDRLQQALASQLASEPPAGTGVSVQLSFVDKSGQYCRSFSADRIAGLACREGAQWTVQTTARADPASDAAMRQAAASLPRAVLDAVDARIAGDTLNAAQEREARDRGWQ